MTRDEFINQLPLITDNPLPVKPPFVFNGLSVRTFPLRASLEALQQLCDGYLNLVPPEVGQFRAAAPFVLLMLIDYGQLEEAVRRIGWFAQIEVFFGVPLEWYKRVNGNWVFHDWAMITPYIFVDATMSVPAGRLVYGFPKSLSKVTRSSSHWIKDPLAPITMATVETAVFPEAYAGRKLETKVFLEIDRAAPVSSFRTPLDFGIPIAPWSIASNLASAAGGFGRDAMWLAQAMRIFPFPPAAYPSLLPEMFQRMMASFSPFGKGFVQNSLNLKQFRRADDPMHICYQGLTNGGMVLRTFNGGGLLGEDRTLLGDVSGGHTVRLYDHSSLPIARTLGLEISESWRSGDVNVAEIKPVMPFWMDVDLGYEVGENLVWRGADGIWKDDTGAPIHTEQKPRSDSDGPLFNTTVTSAIEAVAGPFQFTGTTVRVLPLLAQKEKLQKFLDGFINQSLTGPENPIRRKDGKGTENLRLSVWARPPRAVNPGRPIGGEFAYVYLTASSFAGVMSTTNNVGDWAKYELSFMIPVKFERQTPAPSASDPDGVWETVGVGLVPAFHMVDDCIAAISRMEIQGIDSMIATFVQPESVWLGDTGNDACINPRQTMLRVDADILPALEAGQTDSLQTVIEIVRHETNEGLGPEDSRDTPWRWAESLRLELGTKKATKAGDPEKLKIARALALELLGNQTAFSIYTLKQAREVMDPVKACFQSLVKVPRVIRELMDLQEIEDTLVVRIHEYPSLDIVNTLGLVATTLPDSSTGIIHSAQAIRPFFLRATVDEPLAQSLMDRTGTRDWTLNTTACFSTLLSDTHGAPPIVADYRAETLQDQMDPCRMSAIMYQAKQRLRFSPEERAAMPTPAPAIAKKDARTALSVIDPQMVIESVLSREWGNTNENARWRRGRRELIKAFAGLPIGGKTKAFAESVLCKNLNNRLATPPGAVASMLPDEEADQEKAKELLARLGSDNTASNRWRAEIEKIIVAQENFTRLRVEMEEKTDILSLAAILGQHGLDRAFDSVQETPPDLIQLATLGRELLEAIGKINNLTIVGEPSELNNLDTGVLAEKIRLTELLSDLPQGKTPEEAFEWAISHVEEFREIVSLARRHCETQNNALLNKFSRAYQKPDFCLLRESLGPDRDRLLPLPLSWDEKWYYGDKIERLFGHAAPSPTPPPGARAAGESTAEQNR